jgi:hypothetical protein
MRLLQSRKLGILIHRTFGPVNCGELQGQTRFYRTDNKMGCLKKMAPTCEKNVQIKLTPKNFLLIIFNVVYIEVNETRKKL